MLPAFNMLAASVIALAWLSIALLFPILAVWFGVRVARDLRRIADFCEFRTKYPATSKGLEEMHDRDLYHAYTRHVVNSAFGR